MVAIATMARTCAVCGFRDATTTTEWEGRDVPSCSSCDDPVVDCDDEPPLHVEDLDSLSSRAVFLARCTPGMTSREIGDELGLEGVHVLAGKQGRDRNAVVAALRRAVDAGVLRREYREDLGDISLRPVPEARFFPTAVTWSPPVSRSGGGRWRRWSDVLDEARPASTSTRRPARRVDTPPLDARRVRSCGAAAGEREE